MAREIFVPRKFSPGSLDLIEKANGIITTYMRAGFRLTLRQLYYQFVSRDFIANKVSEYKRLGCVVNDARLAGMIDWNAIEDRTRNLAAVGTWESPSDIIGDAAGGYKEDKWTTQPYRVEVWIEKEALAGIFARACGEFDVPYLSCRGYTSQSEMYVAGKRLADYGDNGQTPLILHFGDHDPSGIDMTRDIVDRLTMFARLPVKVDRLALNMDQIEQYEPPPNPAKETDSRFVAYRNLHGDESWELDALEPTVLAEIVRRSVTAVLDRDAWDEAEQQERTNRALLTRVSEQWDDLAERLSNG